MEKTSEKVTKNPKRQERGKKLHETYMKRVEEKILKIANWLPLPLRIGLCLLRLLLRVILCLLPLPILQYRMILMSITLVYLLSLPLVFVYFLHITLFSLKIKKLSMKNKINHQNDVLCFRKKLLQ